jgi:hypothetical protein
MHQEETHMMDGLWSAQFEAMGNRGSGVAVFISGKVLGGDSGFMWSGTFQESGDSLKAAVHVKNFEPSIQSVFGVNEYDLRIEGKIQGDRITGIGTSPSMGGAKLNVTLIKREGL